MKSKYILCFCRQSKKSRVNSLNFVFSNLAYPANTLAKRQFSCLNLLNIC